MLLEGVADLVVAEAERLGRDFLVEAAARHGVRQYPPLIGVDRSAQVADWAGCGGGGRGLGRGARGVRRRRREIGRAHSELQSLMRISYAVFCLKKKKKNIQTNKRNQCIE